MRIFPLSKCYLLLPVHWLLVIAMTLPIVLASASAVFAASPSELMQEGQLLKQQDNSASLDNGSIQAQQRLDIGDTITGTAKITYTMMVTDVAPDTHNLTAANIPLEYEMPSPEEVISSAANDSVPAEAKLEFRILEVKALDMTNPECFLGWNRDEISLGGIGTSRYGVNKIDYTDLGEFCDGTARKYYDSPWVFQTFSLQDFPDTPSITLVLAERDKAGGRHQFLDELVKQLHAELKKKVEEGLASAVNAAQENGDGEGEVLGQVLEEALKVIIRIVVEELFKRLVEWLKEIIQGTPDDIFTPVALPMTITSPKVRWSGDSMISPRDEIRLSEGTGTYSVIYEWRLIAQPALASATLVDSAQTTDNYTDTAYLNEPSDITFSTDTWGVPPWRTTSIASPPYWWAKPYAITSPASYSLSAPVNITAVHSGKCLDVAGAGSGNGTRIQQWNCLTDAQTNQLWRFKPVGLYYQIVVRHTGKCLDVIGASRDNGAIVHQWDCLGPNALNQLWIARPVGSSYQFIAAHSGKCLDVLGVTKNSGATIVQWDCVGSWQTNQLWNLKAPQSQPPPVRHKVWLPLIQK